MAEQQEVFDVVVVGSGAGGMTAALSAHAAGARVLVIEKSEQYGGTTAMSGGAVWIPCNDQMAELGIADCPEDALRYLEAVTRGRTPRRLLEAYIGTAPAMIRFLRRETAVRFRAMAGYPDYYPEVEGGKRGGRTMEAEPFDGDLLGEHLRDLRPPHVQELVFGRVSLTAAEAHLALSGGWRGQAMVARRMLAYGLNLRARLAGARDRRLALGNALAGRLRKSLLDRGIELRLGTPVRRLIEEDGRIAGIVAGEGAGERNIRARGGVVMAAGGFAHNEAMRRQHQRAPTGSQWTAASAEDTGDGIRLGEEAGAGLDLMDSAWWTPTTVVPGEALPWLLVVEKALPGSIMVNARGERITNEAAPYIDVVEGMFRANRAGDAIPAWLIMDAENRRKYPCGPLLPGRFHPRAIWKAEWREWLREGASVEELASRIGVDGAGLRRTIDHFNREAEAGRDPEFHRGESLYDRYYADPAVRPNPTLRPLTGSPLYAIPVWPGDLGTKGGLVTNELAQALRPDGSAIPGLYAAGNTSASIMGYTYPGAGGTIGPAMTFGFIAGQEAAREAGASKSRD